MTRRQDGKLQVLWEVATKFFLVTYPLAITWSVWVSSEIWTAKATYIPRGEYRSTIDAIDDRIDGLPPVEWKDRIQKMDGKIDKLIDEMTHIRVMVASGQKTQVSK